MEPDRYQQNKLYYIIGMIFLVLSLYFLCLGTYILPHILLGMNYSIPDAVYERINYVETVYNVSNKHASWIILSAVYFMGIMCAFVTYFTSNEIDNKIYGIKSEPVEVKEETKESGTLVLKIVFIIGLVFIVAKLFQWAISST